MVRKRVIRSTWGWTTRACRRRLSLRPTRELPRGRRAAAAAPTWIVVVGACVLAVLTTWIAYPRRPQSANQSPGAIAKRTPQTPQLRRPLPSYRGPSATATPAEPRDNDDATESAARPDVRDRAGESTEDATIPPSPPAPPPVVLTDTQVVADINQQLRDRWQQQQIVPAGEVSDDVWCRRVFSELIGREPYANELRDFVQNTSEDRRTHLVDQLLGPSYRQEFSERWAARWTDWLLQGLAGDSRAFRTGLQAYLAEALAQNQPYDKICADLIAARGANDPTQSDFNGATNYLLAVHEKAETGEVASQVCRSMIGERLSCAQCHDDRA